MTNFTVLLRAANARNFKGLSSKHVEKYIEERYCVMCTHIKVDVKQSKTCKACLCGEEKKHFTPVTAQVVIC